MGIPSESETSEASLDLEWRGVYAPNRHPAIGVPYRRLANRDKRASIQELLDSSLQPTGRVLRIDYVHSGVDSLPETAHEFSNYLKNVLTGRYHIETLQPQYVVGEDVEGEPWLYSLVDKLENVDEIKQVVDERDGEGLASYDELIAMLSGIIKDAFNEGGRLSSEILSPHQYALRTVMGKKQPVLFDVEPDELMDLSIRGHNGQLLNEEKGRLEEVFFSLVCEAIDIQGALGSKPNCIDDIRSMLELAVNLGLFSTEDLEPYTSALDTGKKPFQISDDEMTMLINGEL